MDYRKTITIIAAHLSRFCSTSGSLTVAASASGVGQPSPLPPPPPPPSLSNTTVTRYKASIVLLIIGIVILEVFNGQAFSFGTFLLGFNLCLGALFIWLGTKIAKKGEPEISTPHYGPYSHDEVRYVGPQLYQRTTYFEPYHYFAGTHIRFARSYCVVCAFMTLGLCCLAPVIAMASGIDGPADAIIFWIGVASAIVVLSGALADPLARAYKTNFWGVENFSDGAADTKRAHARLVELGWLEEETPEPAHAEVAPKVRCQFCGELLVETDRKCPHCGATRTV